MIIYKATFPNGKVYIGKTTTTLKKRICSHLSSSKNPKHLINHALNKYKDEVVWEIIVDDISDESLLDLKEIELIKSYNSFGPGGYNLTTGGEGTSGIKWSEESRKKASKSRMGIKYSEETKKRMSIAKTGQTSPNKGKFKEKSTMWGKSHSQETKDKMSKSAESICIEFDVYNLEGEFLGTFLNKAKFERDNNLKKGSVYAVVSGKSKSRGNFIFKESNKNGR